MYALYFEKDQVGHGPGSDGRRNDWEHVVVWVQGRASGGCMLDIVSNIGSNTWLDGQRGYAS